MTVCIAAIADGGASVVLCADQLTTSNLFSWGIESNDPLKKIHYIGDNSVIMAAGNLNVAEEIIRLVRAWCANPEWRVSFGEKVRAAYENVRLEKAQAAFLSPRGLTFASYIENSAKLNPLLIHVIDNDLMSFNLGVDLIAAESREGRSMLWLINNPGVSMESSEELCIGDGAGHALYAMIELKYRAETRADEVEKIVREAKKRSENTRSVGPATSVCYLPRRAEPTNASEAAPT